MSISDVFAAFGLCASVFILGFLFGHEVGKSKGANSEWCRQYFERLEREKARRRANGQFKSNAEKSPNNQTNLL